MILTRLALSFAAAALVAGCGGSAPPIGAPGAIPQSRAAAAHYKVLYRFKGAQQDGAYPIGGMVSINGILYGATQFGGSDGTGTVFAFDLSAGKEQVIADSLGNPYIGGSLLNVDKTLYGAGRLGGRQEYGDIFQVNVATGKTKSICAFDINNGQYPNMGLIMFNGKLYGTTSGGGKFQNGTIFACNLKTGKAAAVISLEARKTGTVPLAGLTAVNGELYGTTSSAGTFYDGTIFKVDTSGRLHTLYTFYPSSGMWPMAPFINVGGTLYGTTSAGGAYLSGPYITGTVFKASKSGAHKLLYSFKGTPDGAAPKAGLTYLNGSFYGTTSIGGTNTQDCRGCGTVFQLTASGTESILYRFKGGKDGALPMSSLTDVKGTLYGTTTTGGAAGCSASGGCGTIFEITP